MGREEFYRATLINMDCYIIRIKLLFYFWLSLKKEAYFFFIRQVAYVKKKTMAEGSRYRMVS
jgi:hypothetical protein